MARVIGARRPKRGSKRIDVGTMKEVLQDKRAWIRVGFVVSEATLDGHDIIVAVEVEPSGEVYEVQVGATMADANGNGIFAIPEEGTEVLIAVTEGEPDSMAVLIRSLGNSQVPERVAAGRILVKCPEVEIQADSVKMSSDPGGIAPDDGIVTGKAVDSFTGATQFALGNASTKVFGDKS